MTVQNFVECPLRQCLQLNDKLASELPSERETVLLPMWRSEILKLVLIAEKIKFIKAKRFKSPPHRVFFPNTKIG